MVNNTPEQLNTAQIALETVKSGNCEQYRELVSQYDWAVNLVLAIMRAESGCNPNAVNGQDSHNGCAGSYSLMQVACLHYTSEQDKLDPAINIQVAYSVYKRAGEFNPWSVYTNKS